MDLCAVESVFRPLGQGVHGVQGSLWSQCVVQAALEIAVASWRNVALWRAGVARASSHLDPLSGFTWGRNHPFIVGVGVVGGVCLV